MTFLVVNNNIISVHQRIKGMGYHHLKKRNNEVNGTIIKHYSRQVKTGRMHVVLNSEGDSRTLVSVHFDKFKHKRKAKYHHKTRYNHPFVEEELKRISEEMKSGFIRKS